MSSHHSVIVNPRKPAGNAGLTQIGKAFRVRCGDKSTYQVAVFRCACGSSGVFRLGQVRSGKALSCGCRQFDSGKKYTADILLMRMRAKAGINVEQSWTVPDDAAAIDALLASIGRCPCGMVIAMVDASLGYVRGNIQWVWPEVGQRQQQTMALARMQASGSKTDQLWLSESKRIERARRKKINDHPVSATIIDRCPLCQSRDIKVRCYRTYSRQYRCNACGKTFSIRRPIE